MRTPTNTRLPLMLVSVLYLLLVVTLVATAEGMTLYHFDLYRLDAPDEIFELGWEEALNDKIVLVEWPERLGPYTPAKARHIDITIDADGSRRISAA